MQESDRESSIGSPEPASTMGIDGSTELHLRQKLLHNSNNNNNNRNDDTTNCIEPKLSPIGNTAAHLNGTSKSINLQCDQEIFFHLAVNY